MDQDIEVDALRALSGADNVERLLLAGLTLGSPSIETLAYVIKTRIKSHTSLVNKVVDRRSKGKTHYRAQDATDIVGLRLLVLFRNELPALVSELLAFLDAGQRPPFNLFLGPDLQATIKEIIIYRTSSVADVTDELIANAFEQVGFRPEVVESGVALDDVRAKAKVVHKPTEYSSIHIVVWCSSKSHGRRKLPMEIQVRTAIEDVWGEIDHRLKYKTKGGDPSRLNEEGRRHYRLAQDQVSILKKQLDGCSLIADSIYGQIQQILSSTSYQAKPTRATAISVDVGRLLQLDRPPKLKSAVRLAVDAITGSYQAAQHAEQNASDEEWLTVAEKFLLASEQLSRCIVLCEAAPSGDLDADRSHAYDLKMERALCQFWIARITKLYLTSSVAPRPESLTADFLELALKEYFSLHKDDRYSGNPILSFRIANALSLRGDETLALEMYRDAVRKLDGAHLPQDHHMRVRIPRFLGVALWARAEEIRRASPSISNVSPLSDLRQRLYLEAISVTRKLVGHPVADWREAGGFHGNQTSEDELTKNNILEYTICYLRAGGTWGELADLEVTEQHLAEYLSDLSTGGLKKIKAPTVADTIRAAAHFLGKPALARQAARRVIHLMSIPRRSLTLPNEAYEEMLEDARSTLRLGTAKPKSGLRKPAKRRPRPAHNKKAKSRPMRKRHRR